MTTQPIAIRNVYIMMAYAFRALRSEQHRSIAAEDFEHVHDLLAEILVRGLGAQVKRGLHHDYLETLEELPTIRGRVDFPKSWASQTQVRGRLVCRTDDYVVDTPHNRALKSVMVLLIRHGAVTKSRRDALRRLLPYLDEVTLVSPTSLRWSHFTYHRATAAYRLLLGVCELIVRGLLPSQAEGTTKLATWVSEEAMSDLYERFLLEYYAFHHPKLSPASRKVPWDIDSVTAHGIGQLPEMKTDVTLQHGGRTLIIDAKYYRTSLQTSEYGKMTVRSAHLYQLLSYTKNADVQRNGTVRGLLLYARDTAPIEPDMDICVQGSRIGARTLDLNRPWPQIRGTLEAVASLAES